MLSTRHGPLSDELTRDAHPFRVQVVETTGREHVEILKERLEQEMNFKGPITSWGQVSL